jgi:hypothetical protein
MGIELRLELLLKKGIFLSLYCNFFHRVCKMDANINDVLKKAGKDALGGGIPGAAAMAVSVSSLMWLRTIINHQYKHGHALMPTLRLLHAQGGWKRFYAGYPAAIVQAPLSRFCDTAANAGMMSLLDTLPETRDVPLPLKTAGASLSAAFMRTALMPIDTVKTMMQVEGSKQGWVALKDKWRAHGAGIFFHGAAGTSVAVVAGHYPWFLTYNALNAYVPDTFPWMGMGNAKIGSLIRAAGIGFCASVASDTTSNAVRVLKTYKQTSKEPISYAETYRRIVETDGIVGLLGRGLKTKIMANGLQGLLFSVLWKMGQDAYKAKGL